MTDIREFTYGYGKDYDFVSLPGRLDAFERKTGCAMLSGYRVNLIATRPSAYGQWSVQATLLLGPGFDPVYGFSNYGHGINEASDLAIQELLTNLRTQVCNAVAARHELDAKIDLYKSIINS